MSQPEEDPLLYHSLNNEVFRDFRTAIKAYRPQLLDEIKGMTLDEALPHLYRAVVPKDRQNLNVEKASIGQFIRFISYWLPDGMR